MRKIIAIGETVFDIIFKNGQPLSAKAGGSMLNTSVSLGRLQAPVELLTEFGEDDIGNQINKFLIDNHVGTKFINQYKFGKTAIAIAFLNQDNEANYSFYKPYSAKREFYRLPVVKKNDIIIFGSAYAIDNTIRAEIVKFLRQAKEKQAILIYDPNFRKPHMNELSDLMPMIKENISLSDIIRGSDDDFRNIFKTSTAEETYEKLSKDYKGPLIYTKSKYEVKLTNGFQSKSWNVKQVATKSTIGAGDGFNAGIIYGILAQNADSEVLREINHPSWEYIIETGIVFGTEICKSHENYIPIAFAESFDNLQ